MRQSQRYMALDAFRGLIVAGMILVNTPGSWSYVYPSLRHAEWHGCTPTDLVFPFFLFITGVAMWFSFKKIGANDEIALLPKIGRRVILIFLIGLALNAFPFIRDYSDLRFLGVLQRIALAYGGASLLVLYFRDTTLRWVVAVLLLGYWVLLLAFGGIEPYGLETNLVRRVDLFLLGAQHLYQGTGVAFDPEGLLSTLPSVATVLLGYLTGPMLLPEDKPKTIKFMLLAAIAALVLGWLWGLVMPINKALWTSSYVLLTAGWAWLLLVLFIWLIDMKGYESIAKPFLIFGMNPLFSYVLSIFWVKVYIYVLIFKQPDGSLVNAYGWLYGKVFQSLAGDYNGSLLFAVSHVLLFWLIAFILWKRKIFIKI